MKKLILLLSLFLTGAAIPENLPEEAQELLKSFPERKLTLARVAQLAIRTSDSYHSLAAQEAGMQVPLLQSAAMTESSLSLDGAWSEDRREPNNPFGPDRNVSSSLGLGLNTQFSTGTRLGFSVSHALTQLRIPNFANLEFAETRGTINLAQSLWRGAFGKSIRATRAAAEHQSTAIQQGLRSDKEDWFLSLSNLYYGAWLQQARLRNAQETVQRRKRLKSIVVLKQRRGTAERPDLIQVEAGLSNAELELASAEQALNDQWRLLAVTLKLPAVVEAVDPLLVPMELDDVPAALGEKCALPEVPTQAAELLRAQALLDAAKESRASADSESAPELDLLAAFGANSVDPNSAATFGDFFKAQFPYYSLGVQFRLPLGNYDKRARAITARVEQMRAEAGVGQVKDLHRANWRNQCFTLARLGHAVKALTKTTTAQAEREKLEEERFSLGRSNLLQVIQAADEANQTDLALKSTMVDYRLAGWKLKKMSGELDSYLTQLGTKGE